MCQSGDSFMWLFSLIQWPCIALCQNIDHVSFHCVSVNGGTMVIEFDVIKTKKRGGKLQPKYCYYNPLDYTLCICTTMGVYFSLLNSTWYDENQYMLFINLISRDDSASTLYTDCINNWVTTFFDHI